MTEDELRQMFAFMDGHVERGGCPACEATHSYRLDVSGTCVIEVRHEDDCPVLATERQS